MCLGIPMKITSIEGIAAVAQGHGAVELVDISLCSDAKVGDWVLSFLGTAREILTPDQADKITAALGGLRALMQGGDLGNAFADLDDRTPQLPPHLQAAFDAGHSHG